MNIAKTEPTIVKPEDIDPGFNWDRAIPAPGHMAVDFEERFTAAVRWSASCGGIVLR